MRFQFSDVTADLDTRQLFRAGAEVHVSPKAFDLLIHLIQARPRVLAKADLHTQLWPDTFVSDANLAVLVAEVRFAIGDNARAPIYVRTVHRRGYAFKGEIAETSSPSAPRDELPAGPGYWIVTSSGRIPLLGADNVIGRDPHAQVWLDWSGVSRRHACIRIVDNQATIEDLHSKNGTYVGGMPVQGAVPLADRDQIRLGSLTVTFRMWRPDEQTRSER